MVKEYFCQFARSYLRPVLSKMSHAGSDSDSLLDLLNDSLEKNDIVSAGDSDYIEKSDHDTSSEFSGTFLSESQTEEVMNERSDP
ncbi:hypothetical protein T05_2642 [Trichinella murrelli]|uniref:Uncharacterized protein n=1 Tax=Trichinella murrelli TaxID=144512 RepID=A0A0V0TRC6_9BILA|nr:hypothetical protein T05_2642 [Trichinella murrelli]